MARVAEHTGRQRRRRRVRKRVAGTRERPRLSVFRSLKHIYAQLVADQTGATLCAASSREKAAQETPGRKTLARAVGRLVAERAAERGIKAVVFDRSGYKYHGRIAALADGAREAGLEF